MTPIIKAVGLGKSYSIHQNAVRSTGATYRRLSEELWETPKRWVSTLFRPDVRRIKKETFWALQNIGFEIHASEVVGFIGRNGAGKSTLLKILSRITEPTTGRVTIRGRVASLLEVGTGFHPELSGRENIFLNGAILGMKRSEIKRQFDEIVAFAEVEQFIDTPVKRYSSGMYVRLAFSVAAHLEPEILIVDEVLAVGDMKFQQKCMGKMQDVAKHGRTVLFVSHNLGAVRQLCSRAIMLSSGTLAMDGTPGQVIEAYLKSQTSEGTGLQTFFAEVPGKSFQVLSGFVCSLDGNPRDRFDCDEAIEIRMQCIVHAVVPGLYGYCEVSRTDGTVLLVADSWDQGANPLDGLGVGTHELRISIPRRVLGHGAYRVDMSFASRLSDFRDDPGIVGTFTLSDNTTSRGNHRGGLLSTITQWNIAPIRNESKETV